MGAEPLLHTLLRSLRDVGGRNWFPCVLFPWRLLFEDHEFLTTRQRLEIDQNWNVDRGLAYHVSLLRFQLRFREGHLRPNVINAAQVLDDHFLPHHVRFSIVISRMDAPKGRDIGIAHALLKDVVARSRLRCKVRNDASHNAFSFRNVLDVEGIRSQDDAANRRITFRRPRLHTNTHSETTQPPAERRSTKNSSTAKKEPSHPKFTTTQPYVFNTMFLSKDKPP
jgi:hypothetical protein